MVARSPEKLLRLERPQRVPLPQVVVQEILRLIEEGQLHPGDRMPSEADMMRILDVGRSTVREGFRALSIMGVIDTRSGKASVVSLAPKSPIDNVGAAARGTLQLRALLDLLEVRESLEGQSAYLAAQRATEADVTTIRDAAELVARDVARRRVYFRSNADFHLAVAKASQNRVLAKSVQSLIGQVRDFREKMMKQLVDMPERDVAEHAAIAEAIAARQPEAARRAMVAHIRSFAGLLEDPRSSRPLAERSR